MYMCMWLCICVLVHVCVCLCVCVCEHADEAKGELASPVGGTMWEAGVWSVSFTQSNTPFVVFQACIPSPAGDSIHLAHLLLEANVFGPCSKVI